MKTLPRYYLIGLLMSCILDSPHLVAQDWFPTGSEPGKYDMGGDPTVEHDSDNPAFVISNASNIMGFGSWATRIDAEPYHDKAITITAYVKSENVQNWAGIWLRVDGIGGSLTFDNMGTRPITGTTDWQPYEVTLDVPAESTFILFGLLLDGNGSVWFDGLKITDAPRTWIPQKTPEDIHAFCIDAIDEEVVWAGAVGGKFLTTTDGGGNWSQGSISGADSLIVNSIVAIDHITAFATAQSFDQNRSDARIYKTSDGGSTWVLQYQNTKASAFFNAIAFWDAQHGIGISDPVDGAFLVVTTNDGGDTWTEVPKGALPEPQAGVPEFPMHLLQIRTRVFFRCSRIDLH